MKVTSIIRLDDGESFSFTEYVLESGNVTRVYDGKGPAQFNGAESVVKALAAEFLRVTVYELGGRMWPGSIGATIPGLDNSNESEIRAAVLAHFGKVDEGGNILFPVQEVIFSGNTIIVVGDQSRVKEMAAMPR